MAAYSYGTDDLQRKIAARQGEINLSYDQQQRQLAEQHSKSRQNASNEALSRGMARSSYAQDRLSRLDSDASRLASELETARSTALQSARVQAEDEFREQQRWEQERQDKLAQQERNEFAKNINAYYENFQKDIDKIRDNGDSSDDWKIPYLQSARQEKILAQQLESSRSKGGGGGPYKSGADYTALQKEIEGIIDRAGEFGDWTSQVSSHIDQYGGEYSDRLRSLYLGSNSLRDYANDTVTIPGYKAISYEDAERLEGEGKIRLLGLDANGNPRYQLTNRRN